MPIVDQTVIYQLPTASPASVGTLPNFKFMVCGNSLVDITTPGYLNQIDLLSNPVAATDVLQILYDYSPQTGVGTYGAFAVTLNNGVISLTAAGIAGEVILPVADGHFASFFGESGTIGDAGFSPSNNALDTVVMFQDTITPTTGDFAQFYGADGSIQDLGVSPSNNTFTKVAMVSPVPPPVVGDLVQFSDNAGSITDSGVVAANLVSLTSPPSILNYLARFSNTTGGITSIPGAAINAGSIQSGRSGVQGNFIVFPATAATGSLTLSAQPNVGDFIVSLTNAPFSERSNIVIPDPLNANGQFLVGATTTPFVNGNFPVASGTSGLMVDSGIPASSLVTSSTVLPKLYVSQAATVSQSVPSGIATQVELTQVTFDTAGGFLPGVYTIPTTGYYLISYQIIFNMQSGDSGNALVTSGVAINGVNSQFLINTGTISNITGSYICTSQCSGIMSLTATQVLSLYTLQEAGGSRTILSNGAAGNTFLSLSLLL